MRRREFLGTVGGAAAIWPLRSRAQQASGRITRIGHLRVAPPPERELQTFLQALAAQGYVQGRNFVLVPQWGEGNASRISEQAVALVNSDVDLIVTEGTIVTQAAAAVTSTVPIVMASTADPYLGGLVKNLSHPGGNITGFTNQSIDIAGKVFEILMQIVGGPRRIAVLSPRTAWGLFAPTEDPAAKALGVEVRRI